MTNIDIGSRIKERREELNLSLQEIAEQVGVAKSTVQRYESGNIGKIKLPVIEAIAKALGVSPSWILGKSERKEIMPPDYQMSRYFSMLKERKDLRDLMDTAIKCQPSETKRLIKVLKALND